MTPQTHVMYAAPLRDGAAPAVRALLQTMNVRPGVYDPANQLVPLHQLGQVHFARLLVVEDLAAPDRAVYGLPVEGQPQYLALLAEIDGSEPAFREALVGVAGRGLRGLFSHCVTFREDQPLADWLDGAQVGCTAAYVNWVGRTVRQVHEEEVLRRMLKTHLEQNGAGAAKASAEQVRTQLQAFAQEQQQQGLLTLTPSGPTPLGWSICNLLHLVFVPLALLLLAPLLLLSLPFLLWRIRQWEQTDPPIAPPVDPTHAAQLFDLENHETTNQFNVFGSLKPGRLRWWVVRFLLWITNYAARHIYNRGNLARVSTIHFARWVAVEGGQRMLFSSLYDGSLESYMDDFINKVGFGLNLTFSNGIGYPRTRWLLLDGCQDEQTFKRVLRRHQLPTEVYYNAHPGLSAANKHRNLLIRQGLEKASMSESQARAWLALV